MYRFALALLAAAMLCGCVTTTATTANHNVLDTRQIDDSDPRMLVIYGNKEFNNKLFVIRKIMDDGNRLAKCSLTLQNVSDTTFVVEYQFQWMEESGMPVMQTAAWARATLPPNAVKTVISVAKTPEARKVEFTIRLPLTDLYKPQPEEKK